jgi:hypothetical protein
MLWRADNELIYVLLEADQTGGWAAFVDAFDPSDPETEPTILEPTPSSDVQVVMVPRGRFGKVWYEDELLRQKLGWAIVPYDENGQKISIIPYDGIVQDFEHGALLWNGNVCFVLRSDDMSWTLY